MTARSIAAALAVLLVVSDCKDTNKPDPTLEGTWSGGYTEPVGVYCDGAYIAITMALAQSDSAVSGSASYRGGANILGVVGTYAYPQVSLTFRWPQSTGFGPFGFAGRLTNASTMTGVVDVDGCGYAPATFTRQ